MARKNANIVSSKTLLTGFTQKPTISGGQTVISGLQPIDLYRVDVYKNGILLLATEDYTVNSTTQITMTNALLSDDDIVIQSISHGYVNTTPVTVDNITVGQYPTVPAGGTQLTLSQAINVDSVLVFKNGVLLKEANDYVVVNNTRIDTIDPMDANDVVHVRSTMDTSTTVETTITGTTAAAPSPAVNSDPDTGFFFNGTSNSLSVSAGGSEVSTFKTTGLDVTGDINIGGGIGIPNYVTLAQGTPGAGVTYSIDSGNTASLTTDSDKTITFTATGGNFTGLGGTGVTLLIKNNTSPDSDRTMTFATSTGNTLHFNSAKTLTVAGGKIGIVSAMAFGDNDIIISSTSLDSSVTY